MRYRISIDDEICEKMVEAFLLKNYSKTKLNVNITSNNNDIKDKSLNIILSSPPENAIGSDNTIYLSRPLSLTSLSAVLDKASKKKTSNIPYIYNENEKSIIVNDFVIKLSQKEAMLFEILSEADGELVSEEIIKNAIWSDCGKSNIVAVYINYLRKKLSVIFGPSAVVSKSGKGYILNI